MGAPVDAGTERLSRCEKPGFACSITKSGTPDARCQLSPRIDHDGSHSSILGPGLPGIGKIGVRDTFLWKHLSGEASPCPLSRGTLPCHTHRCPERTASSQSSGPPYIPSAIGGATHVSN